MKKWVNVFEYEKKTEYAIEWLFEFLEEEKIDSFEKNKDSKRCDT